MNPKPDAGKQATNSALSVVVIFLLLVQSDVLVNVPAIIASYPAEVFEENLVNTIAVSLSILLICIAMVNNLSGLLLVLGSNILSCFFGGLVLLSTFWSIHPELTIRRGVGYVLTLLLSAYLPSRFGLDEIARLGSISFGIAAISSLFFTVIFPQYGIMHGELAGNWRGVFAHKQELGVVMAIAVYNELYLLARVGVRKPLRFILLSLYLLLIVLSDSKTSLLISVFYLVGAGLYWIWRRDRIIGAFLLMTTIVGIFIIGLIYIYYPDDVFNLLNKDATFTGRMDIWRFALSLASERPLLGWGYRALWATNDAVVAPLDKFFGFVVPHAHNTFIEIALQLGLVGLSLLLLIIVLAISRSVRCLAAGINPLGWFSLMFFLGEIIMGQTEITLGQDHSVEWLMFNILLFSCGISLRRSKRTIRRFAPITAKSLTPAQTGTAWSTKRYFEH